MLKISFVFIAMSFCYGAFAQKDSFIDPRDGNSYGLVTIDDKVWFTENLRLETATSYCPNYNRKRKFNCDDGNFYPNSSLDTLCPQGFHLSSLQEWNAYFKFLNKRRGISDHNIKIERSKASELFHVHVQDTSNSTYMFNYPNVLNVHPTGWIQGKRIKKLNTFNVWVEDSILSDTKLHLHLAAHGYVQHTHFHHIEDKARHRRKFVVRCVCNE